MQLFSLINVLILIQIFSLNIPNISQKKRTKRLNV